MDALKVHKVVANLPAVLDKNALYLVRAGAGFDLYATDATGQHAHKINTPEARTVYQIKDTDIDMTNGYPFGTIPFSRIFPGRTYTRPPHVRAWHIMNQMNATTNVFINIAAVNNMGFNFRTNTKLAKFYVEIWGGEYQ